MKKLVLSLMMMAAWMGVSAMSFERAQAEALYLTDKMAYELNLNDQQYNDAYEINLDYFLRIDSPSDLYCSYYSYRMSDLRCILYDWQYNLFVAADYFLRPIIWRAGGWYFPIYSYYNRGYFYYSRPTVWVSYYGGHSRAHHYGGYYVNRRPVWNGGFRGHDMGRVVAHHDGRRGGGISHYRGGRDGSRRINGNGYHIDIDGHRGSGSGRPGRGGSSNYGGSNYNGSHSDGGMNPGGRSHDGGSHSGGSRYGGGNHEGMSSDVVHSGSGRSSFGESSSGRSGSISRGNSFDGSSTRSDISHMSSSSMGGSMSSRGSYSSSPSRSSSSGYGSSHSSSSSMGYGSGMSRGGSSYSGSGSRSGGFSGGSHGGGMSRGGRR